MGDTLFVSDPHFHHDKVRIYSSRPFSSVEEMNEKLIENWNREVKPTDTIYQLGDFSFGKYQDIRDLLNRLNGCKHFILGNHDKVLAKNRYELLRDGLVDTIQDYLDVKIAGQNFVLFHFGQRVWHRSHYGAIHLYGHSHSTLPPLGKSVDVGVDCKEITPEYRPVHLDEVLFYMNKRDFVPTDRHLPKEKKSDADQIRIDGATTGEGERLVQIPS